MTPTSREILALLKTNKTMLLKHIRAHFNLSNIGMNKISSNMRKEELVVSVDTPEGKLWHDKEYADSMGIKSTETTPIRESVPSQIARGEKPYIERMAEIDRYWPKSMAYNA